MTTINCKGIDPNFYSADNRESLFIIRYDEINSEMLDRYAGVSLYQSDIYRSHELTFFYTELRTKVGEKGWVAVDEVLGQAGTIVLSKEMIVFIALQAHPNTKKDFVYTTSEFKRISKNCDLTFDQTGCFIEYGPKFKAFLKRHKIM